MADSKRSSARSSGSKGTGGKGHGGGGVLARRFALLILLAGWAWFMVLTHTPPLAAFKVSVFPHIAGDIIKVLLAAAVLPSGWAVLKRKASR